MRWREKSSHTAQPLGEPDWRYGGLNEIATFLLFTVHWGVEYNLIRGQTFNSLRQKIGEQSLCMPILAHLLQQKESCTANWNNLGTNIDIIN
jgi:hypothetical protein